MACWETMGGNVVPCTQVPVPRSCKRELLDEFCSGPFLRLVLRLMLHRATNLGRKPWIGLKRWKQRRKA